MKTTDIFRFESYVGHIFVSDMKFIFINIIKKLINLLKFYVIFIIYYNIL